MKNVHKFLRKKGYRKVVEISVMFEGIFEKKIFLLGLGQEFIC